MAGVNNLGPRLQRQARRQNLHEPSSTNARPSQTQAADDLGSPSSIISRQDADSGPDDARARHAGEFVRPDLQQLQIRTVDVKAGDVAAATVNLAENKTLSVDELREKLTVALDAVKAKLPEGMELDEQSLTLLQKYMHDVGTLEEDLNAFKHSLKSEYNAEGSTVTTLKTTLKGGAATLNVIHLFEKFPTVMRGIFGETISAAMSTAAEGAFGAGATIGSGVVAMSAGVITLVGYGAYQAVSEGVAWTQDKEELTAIQHNLGGLKQSVDMGRAAIGQKIDALQNAGLKKNVDDVLFLSAKTVTKTSGIHPHVEAMDHLTNKAISHVKSDYGTLGMSKEEAEAHKLELRDMQDMLFEHLTNLTLQRRLEKQEKTMKANVRSHKVTGTASAIGTGALVFGLALGPLGVPLAAAGTLLILYGVGKTAMRAVRRKAGHLQKWTDTRTATNSLAQMRNISDGIRHQAVPEKLNALIDGTADRPGLKDPARRRDMHHLVTKLTASQDLYKQLEIITEMQHKDPVMAETYAKIFMDHLDPTLVDTDAFRIDGFKLMSASSKLEALKIKAYATCLTAFDLNPDPSEMSGQNIEQNIMHWLEVHGNSSQAFFKDLHYTERSFWSAQNVSANMLLLSEKDDMARLLFNNGWQKNPEKGFLGKMISGLSDMVMEKMHGSAYTRVHSATATA